MKPEFYSIDSQIKLLQDRGMLVNNLEFASETLEMLGYSTLITQYSDYFMPPTKKKLRDKQYCDNVEFSEIVSLYEFDINIKNIFFMYLCKAKRNLSSLIAKFFCEKFPDPLSYLNINNYNHTLETKPIIKNSQLDEDKISYRADDVIKVMLSHLYNDEYKETNTFENHSCINECFKNNRGNVPLWVVISELDFFELWKLLLFQVNEVKESVFQ